jgi:hypothetical protein
MSKKPRETLNVVPEDFTAPDPWVLLEKIATELHRIMRRSLRDRWWFLKGKRLSLQERKSILGAWVLFTAECRQLSGTIWANHYEDDRPPEISVNFRSLGEPRTTLTIRVRLRAEGPLVGTLGLNAPRQMSRAQRLFWLTGMRRKRSRTPGSGSSIWWIDPGNTPEDVTLLALLIYLARADLLDSSGEGKLLTLLRKLFGKDRQGRPIDEATLYSAFHRVVRYFAVPQDWRQLRRYFVRARQTERYLAIPEKATQDRSNSDRRLQSQIRRSREDPAEYLKESQEPAEHLEENQVRTRAEYLANEVEIPVRTFYRWLKEEATIQRIPASLAMESEPILSKIRERVHRRNCRLLLRLMHVKEGKRIEAARKSIQRRLGEGQSLEEQLLAFAREGSDRDT